MKGIAVAEGHREKGKEIGRETERERKDIFPIAGLLPNSCYRQAAPG